MKITFTRQTVETINLDDHEIREIIPNLDELEFEEVKEELIKYFWNKDLEEAHGLAQWGEGHEVVDVTDLNIF